MALHTDGATLAFNGYTHQQFVDLFHAIGFDRDNRVVILTGSGNAFMETVRPEGFDFSARKGTTDLSRGQESPREHSRHRGAAPRRCEQPDGLTPSTSCSPTLC